MMKASPTFTVFNTVVLSCCRQYSTVIISHNIDSENTNTSSTTITTTTTNYNNLYSYSTFLNADGSSKCSTDR